MPYSFWDTVQIKGIPGRKKVTEDQKNVLIERAVSTWKSMGLTDPQIAFATTVMGHKSGFDANAQDAAGGSDGYGLGQFTDDTWEDAVNRYNDNYQPGIDAVEHRKDSDAQIRVIGAWVPHIWGKAGEIAGDRNVKGYNQAQIAYGTWNQGPDAHPKEVGDYLKGKWHDPDMGGYFDTTYDRAMQGLKIRKNGEEQNMVWRLTSTSPLDDSAGVGPDLLAGTAQQEVKTPLGVDQTRPQDIVEARNHTILDWPGPEGQRPLLRLFISERSFSMKFKDKNKRIPLIRVSGKRCMKIIPSGMPL